MKDSQRNSKPKPDRVYEPKKRSCLKCQTQFMSSWPGERICPQCKTTSEWRDSSLAA